MRSTTLLAALMLATASAHAQTQTVAVSNAWSRATPPGATTGAVYLTLTSPAADTLVSITSPASTLAQLHQMRMNGDVMEMREVEGGLPLPAGKPVSLEPNGYHIMLIGLKAPLKRGGTVMVHLVFATAPPVDVTASIGTMGESHPPASMPGMHMP